MAGTSQHGKAFIRPKKKAHLLIIEARFHDDLADALLDGATSALKDAGASGTVGPNLDDVKPPKPLVVDRVTNGKGVMPSFKGQLDPDQIDAVATYVSSVAGK